MTGADLLHEAAVELYSADPDEFVARRKDLAARARAAGDTAAAKQIAGLRKPTRSAWIINQARRAPRPVCPQSWPASVTSCGPRRDPWTARPSGSCPSSGAGGSRP